MLGKLTVGVIWSPLDNAENIYIGRGTKLGPSPLGNPYVITGSCSRDEACDKYEDYLMEQMNQGNKEVLAEMNRIASFLVQGTDVNLTCYCTSKGLRCHGSFIKSVIDEKLLDYQAE